MPGRLSVRFADEAGVIAGAYMGDNMNRKLRDEIKNANQNRIITIIDTYDLDSTAIDEILKRIDILIFQELVSNERINDMTLCMRAESLISGDGHLADRLAKVILHTEEYCLSELDRYPEDDMYPYTVRMLQSAVLRRNMTTIRTFSCVPEDHQVVHD